MKEIRSKIQQHPSLWCSSLPSHSRANLHQPIDRKAWLFAVPPVPQAEGRPQQLGVCQVYQLSAQLRAVWRQEPHRQREQRQIPAWIKCKCMVGVNELSCRLADNCGLSDGGGGGGGGERNASKNRSCPFISGVGLGMVSRVTASDEPETSDSAAGFVLSNLLAVAVPAFAHPNCGTKPSSGGMPTTRRRMR